MNYVYAISDGTAIKIGVSKNPHKRIKSLSTANRNRLTLLGYFEGGYSLEKTIHTNYSKIRGEWMHPTPELLEYLNSVISDKHIILENGVIRVYLKIPL